MSHYYKEANLNNVLMFWDKNAKEDSLKDKVLYLEKSDDAFMDDDDDCVEMPPPSSAMVPMSRTLATTKGVSYFVPHISLPYTSLPPHGIPRSSCGGVRKRILDRFTTLFSIDDVIAF